MSKTEETTKGTTDNQPAGQPGFLSCMAAGVKPLSKEFRCLWLPLVQLIASSTGLLCIAFLGLACLYEAGSVAQGGRHLDPDKLPDDGMLAVCVGLTSVTTLAQLAFIGWFIFS